MVYQSELNSKIVLNYIKDLNNSYVPQINGNNRIVVIESIKKISIAVKGQKFHQQTLQAGLAQICLSLEMIILLGNYQLIDTLDYLVRKEEVDKEYMNNCGEILNMYLFSAGEKNASMRLLTLEMLKMLSLLDNRNSKFYDSFFGNLFAKLKEDYTELHTVDQVLFLNDDSLSKTFKENIVNRLIVKSFTDDGVEILDALKSQQLTASDADWLRSLYLCTLKYLSSDTSVNLLERALQNISQESKINWHNITLFISLAMQASKDSVAYFKAVALRLLEQAIENKDSWKLYAVMLLGKIYGLEPAFGMTYLNWYSSTFSSDSNRPLNTEQKAKFFLNAMCSTLDIEPVSYLKVYLHKAAFVPSSCQSDLSDYLVQVKARLVSLNESTEIGFFEKVTSVSAAENDVQCLLKQFGENWKIPQKFLASITFRRQYYEKTFLPHLLASCDGKFSKRHKLIEVLHSTGKISKVVFLQHKESCK